MAFGRLERTSRPAPMSDINMTPLIDVMLVLLVIFIITAPLMTSSLKLDLPKTDGATPSTAPSFMALAAKANPQLEVQLRADQKVPYGRVAELLALIQKAGLNRIGFVTEAPK
jgi:biopolymer transport protein TolR